MRLGWTVVFALAGCQPGGGAVDASTTADARLIEPTAEGVVAHYALDDAFDDGVVAATVGYPGRCTRCPASVAGRFGGGGEFAGTAEIIVAGAPPAFPETQPFSAAVWVSRSAAIRRTACALGELLANTDVDNAWQLCIDGFDDLLFVCTPDGCTNAPPGTVPRARWVHLALTYDGSDLRGYADGVEQVTVPWVRTGGGARMLVIGADVDYGAVVATVPGTIDDVKLWNRALSAAEILAEAMR